MRRWNLWIAVPGFLCFGFGLGRELPLRGQGVAEKPAEVSKQTEPAKKVPSPYLRIQLNEDEEPVAMQTSIVSFHSADPKRHPGVQVDLIGAVHVADKSYFEELNRRFLAYDALLYELVAPEEHNVPENGESRHPVGQMQKGLKSILELDFQLEVIDYRQPNFVHADMSPDEFAQAMKDRGESFLQMMLRMMGQAMASQTAKSKGSDADILFALLSKDRPLRLKRVMARQFEDMEGSLKAIEGPDGSTLIGERNRKALEVLRKELAGGKKKIGIFYGAGHMVDMARRLERDFQFTAKSDSIEWLTAWDMQDNP